MEIVVRRDAFRSGFEVILFAPGCAKKEGNGEMGMTGEGGDSSRKSGRALSAPLSADSPRDTHGIRTREKVLLIPLFSTSFSSFGKTLFSKTRVLWRESVSDICYEDIGARFRTPFQRENGTVSKVSICISFKWIHRHSRLYL